MNTSNRYYQEEVDALGRRQNRLNAAQEPAASLTRLQAAQSEYDATFRSIGTGGAPAPERGESERAYRGRLAAVLAPLTQSFRTIDPYKVVGGPLEEKFREEVQARANDRHAGDPVTGQMRKVTVPIDNTAFERTEWRGDDTRCWMSMFSTPFQCADIESIDKAGNPTLPVRRWGGQ